MKQLILCLMAFLTFSAAAQKKIYLDGRNNMTDSASAKTYALIFAKKASDNVYNVKQYSMSGHIIVEGTFTNEALTTANRFFRNYKVLNGKISSPQTVDGDGSTKIIIAQPKSYLMAQGLIANDSKEGIWKVFYLDGSLKRIENYKNGILEKASK